MNQPFVAMLTVPPGQAPAVVARLRAHAHRSDADATAMLFFRAINRDSDMLVVDSEGWLHDSDLWEHLYSLGVRCHRVPVEAIDTM